MQVVSPQEPLEGATGFFLPIIISSERVCFQTGSHHGLRFDRLLIEAGAFAALLIKTIGTNGNKMPVSCIRSLQVCQPAERLESRLGHGRVGYGLTAQ